MSSLLAGHSYYYPPPDAARPRCPSCQPGPKLLRRVLQSVVVLGLLVATAGAAGVFAWPGERAELVEAIGSAFHAGAADSMGRGPAIAVCGARGGAGATFMATNLAAVFAGRGLRVTLVDLDIGSADVTVTRR